MNAPRPSYSHLLALTDGPGVFEHALLDQPRTDLGYCLDDVARALIVAVREPEQTAELAALTETALRFVENALTPGGAAHNRMAPSGDWTDRPGVGDWWGRAVEALGVASVRAPLPLQRRRAAHAFANAARASSPYLRSSACAAIGAAEVATARPGDPAARRLLAGLLRAVPTPRDPGWPWPEPRLTYANAAVAEALIAAGGALGDPDATGRGLALLDFLLDVQTRDGHLSVVAVGGRGPDETEARFDQQPIEVAALADAAARAYDLTGEPGRLETVRLCWAWFMGANDSEVVMVDLETGAGYDGLKPCGRNENRGAESTLAALSTLQLARRLERADLRVAG